MADNGDGWLTRGQACEQLKATPYLLNKLVEQGRIKTQTTSGLDHSRRFWKEDVDVIRDSRVEHRVPLHGENGTFNLDGHVADWQGHRFIDRVDACWVFLTAHGYLDRETSEALRSRIKADIARSRLTGKRYAANASSATELWG